MAKKKPMLANKQSWSPGAVNRSRWLHPWKPKAAMGDPMQESVLGLSILSALSVAGIHSAINPSYFTLRSFAAQPQARAAAIEGLWIGLAASSAASIAIWLVFDELIPAIVSEATAILLMGIGYAAVVSEPLQTIPPIEQQNLQPPGAAPAGQPIPTVQV